MIFKKLILLFAVIFSITAYAQNYNASDALKYVDGKIGELESSVPHPENPQSAEWVKLKLKAMFQTDQYLRMEWKNVTKLFGLNDEDKIVFDRGMGLRMTSVDSWNTAHLKQLLDHHEWFIISKFGDEADLHGWLLAQHADLDWDFQSKMLPIIESMVQLGESNPSRYAYLYDRVARAYNRPTKTKPQRFGTQGFCNQDKVWEPFQLEDPSRVNDLRAKYGLEPLEEYKKSFNCNE